MFNNDLIIFCELASLKTDSLIELKNNFQKEGFSIKKVKSKVFRVLYKNSSLYGLVGGPIFIIYKNSVGEDVKVLKNLIGLDFVLCCLVSNKLYLSSFLNSFKNSKVIINFYLNIINNLNNILFFNFYHNSIKQINSKGRL